MLRSFKATKYVCFTPWLMYLFVSALHCILFWRLLVLRQAFILLYSNLLLFYCEEPWRFIELCGNLMRITLLKSSLYYNPEFSENVYKADIHSSYVVFPGKCERATKLVWLKKCYDTVTCSKSTMNILKPNVKSVQV